MSAKSKTDSLVRQEIEISLLDKHPDNANKLTGRAFDLLVDNLEKTGFTDPILVRPMPGGRYQIVGGHHRKEAAEHLGFATVPCTIIKDPEFDDEAAAFQLVRMNTIRGKLDPQAFFALYEKLSGKYTNDVMQELFGFAESKEFAKLITQTAKALPPDLQGKFKEAAKEIKTIDGLASLLNQMFTNHGSSLPYGYMIFDYGGQRQIWLQCSKKTLEAVITLGNVCRDKKRTMDDLTGSILQLIANGSAADLLKVAIATSKEVVVPAEFTGEPTIENLESYAAM